MARSTAPTQYPVTEWHLQMREGSSNKFYRVLITETGLCIVHYGRIGTAGQSKITPFPTFAQAEDLGKRQLYAKKAKGYVEQWGNHVFQATRVSIEKARGGDLLQLLAESEESRQTGALEGQKEQVLTHYSEFVDKAKALAVDANGMENGALMERVDELQRVWAQIEDMHSQGLTAMRLAQSAMTQKLLA